MIYLQLIWTYLLIGLFGFGGGYAMLALIERMIVGPGWITERTFTDIVAISQMTPGPIGINSATYIGYIVPQNFGFDGWYWGLAGSILCTLTVVIPSSIMVRYTSHYIRNHHESAYIKGAFSGLRPAVVGLIASAALLLMNNANFGSETTDIVKSIAICTAVLAMSMLTKIHPIWLIVCAGVIGFIVF